MQHPPDIFLSYSREDGARARQFATALERAGFTVWWDQTLRTGEAYDDVTERALRAAKAVVVLWSRASVASRWVRAEATIADRQKTLMPVMIEPCDRPVMFELTQTAEFSDWKGDDADPAWRAFIADLRRLLAVDAPVPGASISASSAPRPRPRSRLAIALVAIAMLPVALIAWLPLRSPADRGGTADASAAPAAAVESASVAVLPFTNLTGDAEKEYFSDGMAEELINALGKVPGLKVASRTSSFAYKGRNTDIRQIARDLDVATVLEGSVRSAGDRVRITVQLINAGSGYNLWSSAYDREFRDVFEMQDDLARQIVTAFRQTTNAALPSYESEAPPTADTEAYRLYLQGVAMVNQNSDTSLLRATSLLESAVARDPAFGRAFLALAAARFLLGQPSERVLQDAQRAADLDARNAGAVQLLRAGVESKKGHWLEAEDMLQSVLVPKRIPEFPGLGVMLATRWPMGHVRKVVEYYREQVREAPANPASSLLLGMALSMQGANAEARTWADSATALGLDKSGRRVLQLHADIAARDGRYAEAAGLMKQALPEGLRGTGAEATVDAIYAAMEDPGQLAQAITALTRMLQGLQSRDWVLRVWAMNWYTRLGRNDLAFESGDWLRRHFGEQTPVNAWAWLWTPELRALRADKGFQPFVTRLGMMPYWEKYGPPDACELTQGKLECRQ